MPYRKSYSKRRQTGAAGALFFLALVLVIIGLGAFAVDFAHVLTVRNELQNAVDAASLAGAQDLVYKEDGAEEHALNVASINKADNKTVSNDDGTEVTVQVEESPNPGDPHTVQVSAEMNIQHLLAPIFGRQSERLAVTSRAGGYENITVLDKDQAFPIAIHVSDWPNGNGPGRDRPVNQLKMGDPITIVIDPSANPGRNAAWTSFNIGSANTNTYVDLIERALGMADPDNHLTIPAVTIGETEIALDNGNNLGTDLNGRFMEAIKAKPFLIMPVFKGTGYNQKKLVIGFVTVKVKNIRFRSGAWEITGNLVKGLVRGWGGEVPGTGNGNDDKAVAEFTPGVVKLLSASSN